MRSLSPVVRVLAVLLMLSLPVLVHAAVTERSVAASPRARKTDGATGSVLPGTRCPAFPANNVWNTPIAGLPVDSHSAGWLKNMAAGSDYLHPDYGPGGGKTTPYGIPWQITAASQPLVKVRFQYSNQSERGPYPFGANTPIEGGAKASGDRHALIVDPRKCVLYELYDAYYHAGNKSTAGSGAIWSLTSNGLRPAGWTSADAAGLAILPGLVNYDEVMSGRIDHAIRFTAHTTDTAYIWPARHEAGAVTSVAYPPMGARFRLSASFRLPSSKCAKPCQVMVTAMKAYGLIVADNGSNWYFQGTTDRRWTYAMIGQLKLIPAAAFQAVDASCLMISANSGQALQPGTPAYHNECLRAK